MTKADVSAGTVNKDEQRGSVGTSQWDQSGGNKKTVVEMEEDKGS